MITRFFVPLLAAGLLVLPACQTDDTDTTIGMQDTLATDPMSPMVGDTDADRTGSLLESGVTTISPQAAIDEINSWMTRLDTADFDNASSIRSNLESLRSELQGGTMDGNRIADLLETLGTETAEAAQGIVMNRQMGMDGQPRTDNQMPTDPAPPGAAGRGTMGADAGAMGRDRDGLMRLANALQQAAQQIRGGGAATGTMQGQPQRGQGGY